MLNLANIKNGWSSTIVKNDKPIGLSIIVCNYNSDLSHILLTLASCIYQKGCDYEVIYCDDGSENSFKDEVVSFFKKHKFKNYQLQISKTNQGTLKNLINGLKVSKFRYCKTIGSGDLFYDENSLSRVVEKFEYFSSDVIIVNSCYFFDFGKEIKTYKVRNPYYIKCYQDSHYNKEKIKKRLLLNQDMILGASVYARTDMLLEVYEDFTDKIKYTEDALLAYVALIDGKFNYVDDYCIYYEYGSGISTSKETEFSKIIKNECETIYDYMSTLKIHPKYKKWLINRKKVRNASGIKALFLKLFVTPSQFKIKIASKHVRKETPSFDFYHKCKESI